MQGDRRVDAFHDEHAERALHTGYRFVAITAVRDQLGDQRIVIRRNYALRIDSGIDTNADAAGQIEAGDLSGRWHEGFRMLGVDAAFDRMAAIVTGPGRMSGSVRPAAMRICALTRSMPVMSSVTGCSTWMRAFTSMKYSLPFSSIRNSTVPALV